MYESFYGFQEKPFNLTPDPKYLYLSQRHAEAFAHLEFGHRERGGFILITGEVGMGKTTLARYFLSRLGSETHTAVVLYPALTATELLHSILDDLHVAPAGGSLKSLVDALHRFLLDARAAGRDVVLLIDEAQDLSPEVLEQIRLISNLETDTEKLIQIVLVGQSELRDLLARHELRQLGQRITARYHLSPLSPAETQEYIRHRLKVAGGEGKVGFTAKALQAVHQLSGGVPRLINLICDRALLGGYARGQRTIVRRLVDEAAREVTGRPAPALRWHHGLVAAGLAVALLVLAFAAAPRLVRAPADGVQPVVGGQPDPALEPTTSPTPVSSSAPPASPPRSARFEELVLMVSREASLRDALARVEAAWGRTGLSPTSLRTRLEQVRRLDLPVVLELFHPSRPDTCFAAVLRLDERVAVVRVGAGAELEVPAEQLDELWTRDALFPWPEPPEIRADRLRAGLWSRQTLRALGYDEADIRRALSRFQLDAGIVADARFGPRTRLALFALSPGPRPRLSGAGGTP